MATRINNESLNSVPCRSVAQVLELIKVARSQGLRASYHPQGGDQPRQTIPASHTLWVLGESDLVRNFCLAQAPVAIHSGIA